MTGARIEDLLIAGQQHHAAGDLVPAARCYLKVLDREPDHARACHLLGLVHAQTGDLTQAFALVGRALRIDPDLAEAHQAMARLHARCGQLEESALSWRMAIRAAPDAARAYAELGMVLADLGRQADAIDTLTRALALDPGLTDAKTALLQAQLLQWGDLAGQDEDAPAPAHTAQR